MKELSIEEKAKRYDDAIKKAGERYNEEYTSTLERSTLAYVFQELKESEDERIRKQIIYAIKELHVCDETKRKCIAWIEKQGEQKHTAEEVLIKAGLKPYKDGDQWCVLLGDNIQEGICGFGNTIEDALYAFLKDLIARQGEQKPAWSEKNIANVFEKVGLAKVAREQSNDALTNALQDAMIKLSKFIPQPKQEWSEEDEELMKWSINNLTELKDRFGEEYGKVGDCINWLKSLRPNHWKPSEKQMEALANALSLAKNCGEESSYDLRILYEQLKKLREE